MNVWLAGFCLVTAALVALSARAEQVSYTEANRDILVGAWKGELIVERRCQSECRGGRLEQQRKVTLKVTEPARGKFTIQQKNRTWLTDIEAKDGSPWMRFGKQVRQFDLSRDGADYRLSLKFETMAQGFDREHTLVLEKQ